MKIVIVTDAWHPQVNGVVETMTNLVSGLRGRDVRVEMITPQDYPTVALPTYPDIRLALARPAAIRARIAAARPDVVHIVTEGPLGVMARSACLRGGIAFTTSYHTRFPEYLRARLPFPTRLSYGWLRRFHNAGAATLAATPSLVDELTARGFTSVRLWTRGVDAARFNPQKRSELGFERPVFLSVGRVAVEKNLRAFLDLDLPGTKLVVGDGPDLAALRAGYRQARFLGARFGEDLARIYASADVFVFPSRTDTFGIVLLEALASGLPVAAYPVTGPRDVLAGGRGGALDGDLRRACLGALGLSRHDARALALSYGWAACVDTFLDHASTVISPGLSRAA